MNNRKVLSLKYRPQNFDQLIGQESMSTAIQNAIEMDRVPNAYLLTGIRGVGKTTTARIIAKAINCNKIWLLARTVSPNLALWLIKKANENTKMRVLSIISKFAEAVFNNADKSIILALGQNTSVNSLRSFNVL